jgi:hypothetical protein
VVGSWILDVVARQPYLLSRAGESAQEDDKPDVGRVCCSVTRDSVDGDVKASLVVELVQADVDPSAVLQVPFIVGLAGAFLGTCEARFGPRRRCGCGGGGPSDPPRLPPAPRRPQRAVAHPRGRPKVTNCCAIFELAAKFPRVPARFGGSVAARLGPRRRGGGGGGGRSDPPGRGGGGRPRGVRRAASAYCRALAILWSTCCCCRTCWFAS